MATTMEKRLHINVAMHRKLRIADELERQIKQALRNEEEAETAKELLALAPEELRGFLEHIRAFERLMCEGTMKEVSFRIPNMDRHEMAKHLGVLAWRWIDIASVTFEVPQHLSDQCTLTIILRS